LPGDTSTVVSQSNVTISFDGNRASFCPGLINFTAGFALPKAHYREYSCSTSDPGITEALIRNHLIFVSINETWMTNFVNQSAEDLIVLMEAVLNDANFKDFAFKRMIPLLNKGHTAYVGGDNAFYQKQYLVDSVNLHPEDVFQDPAANVATIRDRFRNFVQKVKDYDTLGSRKVRGDRFNTYTHPSEMRLRYYIKESGTNKTVLMANAKQLRIDFKNEAEALFNYSFYTHCQAVSATLPEINSMSAADKLMANRICASFMIDLFFDPGLYFDETTGDPVYCETDANEYDLKCCPKQFSDVYDFECFDPGAQGDVDLDGIIEVAGGGS
jgi:hypothetical protein